LWKRTQRLIFANSSAFQSSNVQKTSKSELCSFCELPAWWKPSKRPLFTKSGVFENSNALKTSKSEFFQAQDTQKQSKKQTLFIL